MKLFLFLLYAFLGVGYMYRGMKGDDKYYAYLSLIWMFSSGASFYKWVLDLTVKEGGIGWLNVLTDKNPLGLLISCS